MKAIAIIPARGGSRRLPRKNARDLCGLPLFMWTARVALAVRGLSVWVSSDDPEIQSIAREAGCEVYCERTAEFGGDLRLLRDCVADFAGGGFDVLMPLLPTYPFRSVRDLERVLALMRGGAQSVQSATWIERCSFFLPNSFLAAVHRDFAHRVPVEQVYIQNDRRQGIDIDTDDDWARAERLAPLFDWQHGAWAPQAAEVAA